MIKACHRPNIANDEIIAKHNCIKRCVCVPSAQGTVGNLKEDRYVDSIAHPSGWSFKSHHSTILKEAEHLKLNESVKLSLAEKLPSLQSKGEEWLCCDTLEINNCKLHVPPMLFGKDFMEVRFGASAIVLRASDAIICWAAQVGSYSDFCYLSFL